MRGAGWAWLALDQSADEAVRHLVDSGFGGAGPALVQGLLKVPFSRVGLQPSYQNLLGFISESIYISAALEVYFPRMLGGFI